MNIFVLDEDPRQCAIWTCDKHVVKMVTETAQLLCSTYYFTGEQEKSPYGLAYGNHPCAKWAREGLGNWIWLRVLGLQLYREFRYRYGDSHAAGEVIKKLVTPNIPDKDRTPFALCMPDDCKIPGDAVASYRKYYCECKRHLFAWKYREVPYWIIEYDENKKLLS